MAQKLNLLGEEIVIGSHTLAERKFQVLNFMNMLYDNICPKDGVHCMAISSVSDNLLYEIGKCEQMRGITFEGKSIVQEIRAEVERGQKLLALRDYHILLLDLVNTFGMHYLIKSINY